jgi:transcriptional regulator with XRE-family HTH domain
MELNKRLKQARTTNGLTIRELGRLIDAGETLISAWESGRRNPSADTLRKYVMAGLITAEEALGVDSAA